MNVIALANPKGGCGKTTTAVNLAAGLGAKGLRVLLVDLDGQGEASLGLGIAPLRRGKMCGGNTNLADVIVADVCYNVDLAPGAIKPRPSAGSELQSRLDAIAEFYDYALIDCPSGVGKTAMQALGAAHRVLVPVELGPHAVLGIERLRDMLPSSTRDVHIALLPSKVDKRSRVCLEILGELKERYAEEVVPVGVRRAVQVQEAARRGRPVLRHAPQSPVADDFIALAEFTMGRRAPRAKPSETHRPPPAHRIPNLTFSESMGRADDRHVVLSYHHLPNKDLQIAGEFNDWIPDHEVETRVVNDTLQKVLRVRPGSYQYRVIIDGKWQEDPANPVRVPNSHGGSNSLLRVIP